MPLFKQALLIQSQKTAIYGLMLDQFKPAAIVTEYDRAPDAAPLILAAKARGIPTMTMFHGTINPAYGYHPLLADLAFCWGKQHYEQMLSLETAPERLVITGCQRLTRQLDIQSGPVRNKIGISDNRPLVVLATNPISPVYRKQLVRVFGEALRIQPSLSGAVRLHPSENLDFYKEEIDMFQDLKFLPSTAWSLDESLAAADVIVIHNSGVGNDALVKDKTVVVLDVLPIPPGNGDVLVERAGCPRAKNAHELSRILNHIMTQAAYRQQLHQHANGYVDYFCAAFSQDACDNIMYHIYK